MKDDLAEFHILIIDDDQDDHFFFINALEDIRILGLAQDRRICVSSTYDGIQGMNFLLKEGAYKDSVEPLPDFMVLDLFMPMKNGYSVLQEIKGHPKLKSIPVFVLTSSARDHKERCLASGCSGFFSKPFKAEELKAAIMQMFLTL